MISDPQKYQSILPSIEQLYKKALEVGDTGEEGNVRGLEASQLIIIWGFFMNQQVTFRELLSITKQQ